MKRIVIPESFIYSLLTGKSNSYDIKRTTSFKVFEEYLIPPRDRPTRGFVDLKPITVVGFMAMGKTVFAAHVTKKVRRKLSRRFGTELFSVMGKSIVDVVEFLKDNKDLYQDKEAMLLFLDDIFYQGLSTEKGKAKNKAEKYYSDIRHQFEKLGFNNGILYIIFAGQRLKLIPPFFRSSPMLIFKPLLTNDKYERQTIIEALQHDDTRLSKTLAELSIAILETAAKIIYTKWDDQIKSITIVKPGWDYPFIYIQDSAPNPKNVFDIVVPFNYSGIYGDENEEEVMRRIDETAKRLLLKLAIKSIAVGMELRDKGIYSLSKKGYEDIIREALKLPFGDKLLSWNLIEESLSEINYERLKQIITHRVGKPIAQLAYIKRTTRTKNKE